MNYVLEYIEKIESGEILVSKKVKKWYVNKIKPIILDQDEKYFFDEDEGERFIKFSKVCKQSKGKWAGQPVELMLFQKAKYQCIFGIFNRETGKRRFKEIFDVRGRKNGKSTENSVLGLYLTLEEKGAEIYVAATTQAQARRVWEESVSMVDQSPVLTKRFGHKVFPQATCYTKQIPKSSYNVLSKNVSTFDGLNANGAIIDEVHELQRSIYDILKQSTSVREQPLVSMITTAGFVRMGLFDDMYDYSSKVIDGIVEDDTLFPLIYELDNADEIFDSQYYIKANPAVGVIKKLEDLVYNVERMKNDLNFANTVKTKDFNLIGVENKAWLPFEVFNNTKQYSSEEMVMFDNTEVIGGMDLSRTGDMTSFTTMMFNNVEKEIVVETMYWITADFYKKQTQEVNSKVPWRAWVDRGLVRISGSNLIDYHDVANYISNKFQQHGYMYKYINYDSYTASYLVEEIASLGYAKDYCLIPTYQGYKTLSIPMQTLEAHLKEKKLCYQNNPVTKWCLSNVELVQDRNGNYMPKKCNDSESRKIDGVATILDCYVSLCQNMQFFLEE